MTLEGQPVAEPALISDQTVVVEHPNVQAAAAESSDDANAEATMPFDAGRNAPVFERLWTADELAARQSSAEAEMRAQDLALRARAGMDLDRDRRNVPENPVTDPARTELYRMQSAILPDDRVVTVYVPPQYHREPARRFPVLYLHDGQNLFDPSTSYIPGRTWRAGSTADRVNRAGTAEPLILVGIANTGLRRMAEYTPTRDPRLNGGEGESYGRLIIEELKPFVDRTWRTQPQAQATGVGGSSLGGLISLFLGFTHPEIFGRVAALSPSIWWDQRSILRIIDRAEPKPELRIWLDIGTAEGWRHVRDTERLNQMLLDSGWHQGVDLACCKVEGGLHEEGAWANRFDQVLNFLYPAAPR